MANSPLAIITERHQKSDTNIVWKNPLEPVTSTITNGLYPSWESWCLLSYHQLCCLLHQKCPRVHINDKMCKRKNCNTILSNPDKTFKLQLLQPYLPIPHWPYQPQTCLQSTWTTPFLIFPHEVKPQSFISISKIINSFIATLDICSLT